MAPHSQSAMEMLKEIPFETAQQMFNAVRYQSDPPGSTMIPDLDEYLIKSIDSVPSRQSSLNRGDIIEIQGPAASGKSQLLYHLAAVCLLPSEFLLKSLEVGADFRVTIGGWEKSVVVLDCDGRWDVRRLHVILVTRVRRSLSMAALPPLAHEPDLTSIISTSLSRLHYFRPTSSLQLAATLLTLPKYHEENMTREEIRMLLIDSISSFYWTDRWQAEPSGIKKAPRSNPLGNVLRSLQEFRLSHGPVTVLTNWGLNPLSSPMPSVAPDSLTPFFKQHLASSFPAPFDEPTRHLTTGDPALSLTCHITIPFAFVSPLQSSLENMADLGPTGVLEALCDKSRKSIVEKGEVGAYIRNPRPGRTQDPVLRHSFGRFKFQILESDVIGFSDTAS